MGVVGPRFLPSIVVWVVAVAFLAAGGVVFHRSVDWRKGKLPPDHGITGSRRWWRLRPGERYESSVALTTAPNVEMGELICSDLRAHGIEAVVRHTWDMYEAVSKSTSDLVPVDVWVGKHDLARAQALLAAQRA